MGRVENEKLTFVPQLERMDDNYNRARHTKPDSIFLQKQQYSFIWLTCTLLKVSRIKQSDHTYHHYFNCSEWCGQFNKAWKKNKRNDYGKGKKVSLFLVDPHSTWKTQERTVSQDCAVIEKLNQRMGEI